MALSTSDLRNLFAANRHAIGADLKSSSRNMIQVHQAWAGRLNNISYAAFRRLAVDFQLHTVTPHETHRSPYAELRARERAALDAEDHS